jgi:hypothetical protein
MATKKPVKAVKKTSVKKAVKKKPVAKKVAVKKVVSKKKLAAKKILTKKAVKKSRVVTKLSKARSSATKKEAKEKIDYFKLPFEVYYSEYVPVTQSEFKSDVNPQKFSDIKAAHEEQGGCWGLLMECSENNGPELYCCITNNHDEVDPPWLSTISEDNIDFNYGHDYKVVNKNNTVKLVEFSEEELDEDSEEYINTEDMDYCSHSFFVHHLDQGCPDYLILDAENTRIKVDLEGYVLDDEENRTSERVFDPDNLDEDLLENYDRREFDEARQEWIDGIMKDQFPKEKKLMFVR